MPRGVASRADQELIAALRTRGLPISPYQLERWRQAGLLPKNVRRSLGRGRGSTSEPAPDALACALTVASAVDPKPSNVLWSVERTLIGVHHDMREIASRPVCICLDSLLRESDLIDMDEDHAYSLAADLSSPYFVSFSPERHHSSLNGISDIVAHKRHIHEHYLVASYLGVAAVGRSLLKATVIQLGFAIDNSAEALLDLMEANFTTAEHRHAILDRIEMPELAYHLCMARTLLELSTREGRVWPIGIPASDAQLARYRSSPLEFLGRLRRFRGELSIAVTICLLEQPHFYGKALGVLGEEWDEECRSRISSAPFGVLIHPLSKAAIAKRDRQLAKAAIVEGDRYMTAFHLRVFR